MHVDYFPKVCDHTCILKAQLFSGVAESQLLNREDGSGLKMFSISSPRPCDYMRRTESPGSVAVMYQEVAFLAGSTERQFTTFLFNRVETKQEVTSKKGVFYKRAQLLLQPQARPQDGDEVGLADSAAIINCRRHQVPHPLVHAGRVPPHPVGKVA
ncbi:hypothetical protein fugu_018643 [Takifugu bimaculatus]|uniref:Uncharacterized protein n=1 Tax=Takifugu bimaculatus TaxID=433685 RepID=A0A4Z2BLP5_9TELE|nr:hypothetical protein fugu_018643 [Takifugu bimaculatus]